MSGDLESVTDTIGRQEATIRIRRIRTALDGMRDDIIALYRGRAWLAMGYDSWDALCDGELGQRPRLPIEERREVVAELTDAGMSTRAIGTAIGVSNDTVARDQQQSPVSNETPDRQVEGKDGKTYPRRRKPEPVPEPPVPQFSQLELGAMASLANRRSVVVNMSRDAVLGGRLWPWAQQQGIAVRIDRKSKWGNPFIVGEDGDRDQVIALFAEHYLPYKKALDLDELRGGLVLGCWCAPLACHGDHLLR